MKSGGGGGSNPGGKRLSKLLGVGVLFLVFLSMFVPLVFLLGVHTSSNPPPTTPTSEFLSDESTASSAVLLENSETVDDDSIKAESIASTAVDSFIQNEIDRVALVRDAPKITSERFEIPDPPSNVKEYVSSTNDTLSSVVTKDLNQFNQSTKETHRQCEMRFGSYCLWRKENEEDMVDSMVNKMKDLLFVARAYYPSVAKLPAHEKLSLDLRQNIQEFERILSECSTDRDLPEVESKIEKMESVLSKAKAVVLDCSNVDKKLRQILDMTEDEANFHMKQSAFLYQLAVQTKSKSLHCLFLKLTVEYFNPDSAWKNLSSSRENVDYSGYNYVIFSNNILASSVVINSTIVHAKDTQNLIFHILTDRQSYFAMNVWFSGQKYGEATVNVLNVEDIDIDLHDLKVLLKNFMPVEFRVSIQSIDNPSLNNIRTEYLSVFSPAHFLLPYIFPTLKRIVLLDDDVVVQKDLSDLWSMNMEGKVNGALNLCSVQLKHLSSYLAGKRFNENSCVFMSGLNVIDLSRWRDLNLTHNFVKLTKEVSKEENDPQITNIIASIIALQDHTHRLDDIWTLPGLGHNYDVDVLDIRNSFVLHYNGNMKPWLEIGIPAYKQYWKKFIDRDNRFLSECNVHT